MPDKTKKIDWLTDLMAAVPGMLVSGHPSFSETIGYSAEEVPVIRYLRDFKSNFYFILTIHSDPKKWDKFSQELDSNHAFMGIIKTLSSVLKSNISVVFCSNNPDDDSFFLSLDLLSFQKVNSKELQTCFGSINPVLINDPGTGKEVNKTLNDSFHVWTRLYLSRYLTVSDLDAINIEKPHIFEVKKIKDPAVDWRPYLDEYANYSSLKVIYSILNIPFSVIAYNEKPSAVALHWLDSIERDQISGRFVLCRPRDIINTPLGTPYISKNRRQK